MTDILVTTGSEFMVSRAEGATDAGTDFIDAFIPPSGGENLTVKDSGNIVFPDADLGSFMDQAEAQGLTIDIVRAKV